MYSESLFPKKINKYTLTYIKIFTLYVPFHHICFNNQDKIIIVGQITKDKTGKNVGL